MSAWILLAVFVPMLVLSSLHVHSAAADAAVACDDCLHHVQHSGHLLPLSFSPDDCVLCQMLSMTYTAATAVAAVCAVFVCITVTMPDPGLCPVMARDTNASRAPPTVS